MRLIRQSAQARELARDGGGGERVEHRKQMGAAETSDADGRPLEGAEQTAFGGVEEVDAFDGLAADRARPGERIENPDPCREVVESGEEGEITAVTAKEDLAKVRQAVDRLFDGGEGAGGRPGRCFQPAMTDHRRGEGQGSLGDEGLPALTRFDIDNRSIAVIVGYPTSNPVSRTGCGIVVVGVGDT
jgi:hypothetical protein